MNCLYSRSSQLTRALFIVITLFCSQAFAHVHSLEGLESPQDLQRMRLIDRGNGSAPTWMTFGEAMGLSEKAHQDGRCAGFMDITDQPALESGFFTESMPLVEYFKLDLADRPLKQQRALAEMLPRLNQQELYRTVSELSAFRNRYYKSETGVQAAGYIANRFQVVAKNRTDIRVDLFKHKWPQPSVVATIAGQGPKANEIVVIGGHLDSINQTGFGSANMSAPGADDNASGTATVIEVFRTIVESGFIPNRTLMFMGYAAEEVGLWGSQEIANSFKANGRNVVAVMQLDMTAFPGAGTQIVFMRDFTHPALTTFTQKLADTYVQIPWSMDQCGYACSDHASWHKAGFAAVMPFEATFSKSNKAIHTVNDLIQRLNFNHALHFAKLGLAFMTELARG